MITGSYKIIPKETTSFKYVVGNTSEHIIKEKQKKVQPRTSPNMFRKNRNKVTRTQRRPFLSSGGGGGISGQVLRREPAKSLLSLARVTAAPGKCVAGGGTRTDPPPPPLPPSTSMVLCSLYLSAFFPCRLPAFCSPLASYLAVLLLLCCLNSNLSPNAPRPRKSTSLLPLHSLPPCSRAITARARGKALLSPPS